MVFCIGPSSEHGARDQYPLGFGQMRHPATSTYEQTTGRDGSSVVTRQPCKKNPFRVGDASEISQSIDFRTRPPCRSRKGGGLGCDKSVATVTLSYNQIVSKSRGVV